jgi:DNA-binding NarL/FixJ family response regulator
MADELGLGRSWDPWNVPGLALVAYFSGRWADAERHVAESRAFDAKGMPRHYLETIAAMLFAGRGQIDEARVAVAVAEANAVEEVGEFPAARAMCRAAIAEAAGDHRRRLGELETALALLDGTQAFVFRSRLVAEAASAAADLVETLRPRRDAELIRTTVAAATAAAALAAHVDDGTTVPGTTSVPWTRANAALAAAEAARADGRDDAAAWPPIIEAFSDMGMDPRVAYAQFRAATAAFGAGDRGAGAALIRDANGLASAVGMTVLLGRIATLARAARVELTERATSAAPASTPRGKFELSARELEVLALIADGRTNGEIGTRLFISTKTASVHVTHILDKLGVSTRTEAALLASRAGILDGRLRSAE